MAAVHLRAFTAAFRHNDNQRALNLSKKALLWLPEADQAQAMIDVLRADGLEIEIPRKPYL